MAKSDQIIENASEIRRGGCCHEMRQVGVIEATATCAISVP
jgi:hypothetical protein